MTALDTAFSPRRVGAMVLRYLFLMRGSWPRIIELIYWPTVQMILWGFITKFLVTNSSWVAQAAGVLISAVLLWDIMARGQLGVSLMFFEEMYSRNLGHLFVIFTELRPLHLRQPTFAERSATSADDPKQTPLPSRPVSV